MPAIPNPIATQRRQAAFDTVLQHMRKQRNPAVNSEDVCRYRGEGNEQGPSMCAAGCLIPDIRYRPQMEGQRITTVRDNFDLDNLFKNIERLVSSMQDAHDQPAQEGLRGEEWLAEFESRMACVAAAYFLAYTPPEAA